MRSIFLIVKLILTSAIFLIAVSCETPKDMSTTFKYVRLVHVCIENNMFCVKGPLEYRYDWTFYIICTYIINFFFIQKYYCYIKVFLYYYSVYYCIPYYLFYYFFSLLSFFCSHVLLPVRTNMVVTPAGARNAPSCHVTRPVQWASSMMSWAV